MTFYHLMAHPVVTLCLISLRFFSETKSAVCELALNLHGDLVSLVAGEQRSACVLGHKSQVSLETCCHIQVFQIVP